MKRSIILFLITFLVTAGVVATFYYYKSQPALEQGATPAQQTQAVASPADATPVQDEKTATADADQTESAKTETVVIVEPVKPEEVETPVQTDESGADDSSTEEGDSEETPSAGSVGKPIDDIQLPEGTKTSNEAHKRALTSVEAFKSEDAAEYTRYMVANNMMSEEASAVVTEWFAGNTVAAVEEVGDVLRYSSDKKLFRYRVVSANGDQDLLLDFTTDISGKQPYLVAAHIVPADRTMMIPGGDTMMMVECFLHATRQGNVLKARNMVDLSSVDDATLAGLCMIFEEGTFSLSKKSPIRCSISNPSSAGYLVYVVPADNPDVAYTDSNHIAVNLVRIGEDWKISAVGTDKLLAMYLESAQAEGGRYSPLVKNPQGGQSIALYFAFDDSTLTPRSIRQLEIVAKILVDSKKKLDIAGHTDDLGSEEYNLALSQRRAEAVRQVLIDLGVSPDQITTTGLGKNEPRNPITETDDESQIEYKRGENRRAEIYLDFES